MSADVILRILDRVTAKSRTAEFQAQPAEWSLEKMCAENPFLAQSESRRDGFFLPC